MLATYHMTDPLIFYNKEDVWEIPTEIYENSTEPVKTVPYYQVLALPGETEPEFALVLPFTPLSKQNMSSLLVARQDGDNYGKLAHRRLPQGQAGLRAGPDRGPHQQRARDLLAAHAVGPVGQQGHPRQPAGGPRRPTR